MQKKTLKRIAGHLLLWIPLAWLVGYQFTYKWLFVDYCSSNLHKFNQELKSLGEIAGGVILFIAWLCACSFQFSSIEVRTLFYLIFREGFYAIYN